MQRFSHCTAGRTFCHGCDTTPMMRDSNDSKTTPESFTYNTNTPHCCSHQHACRQNSGITWLARPRNRLADEAYFTMFSEMAAMGGSVATASFLSISRCCISCEKYKRVVNPSKQLHEQGNKRLLKPKQTAYASAFQLNEYFAQKSKERAERRFYERTKRNCRLPHKNSNRVAPASRPARCPPAYTLRRRG